MKKDKGNNKEPFPPEKTPSPPQVMNPSSQEEVKQNRNPTNLQDTQQPGKGKPENKTETDQQNKSQQGQPSNKRLGESETEIDDETTI